MFEYDGRKVHLIDTPGFDQSGIRSSWVLFQIAFFLAAAYKNGISINGFVYVQGFTQETLDGYFEYPGTLASPSLEMLSMMVGAGKQSHIVLATSPRYLSRGQDWGAAQRQFLLMKWKSVMGKGSQIFDLDRSRSAALPVVSWFASQQQLPGPLRIQCELVDWHQVICLTGFGTRLIRLWKNSHLQLNHVFDVNEFCLDPLYAGNHAKEIEGTKQRTDSTQGEHRTRNMWWHFSRMLKLASPPTGEGIDALQSNLGYIVDQEAHITGLWEDWLLQSLQGSVIDQSGRPKDYRADSVGSFLSYEKPTIEEIVLPVGADNVKSPDLSSDTSSDEGDESTGLKSRIAQNQNRISAQAFPPPRYAAKSFSAERRVTGSNPHTNHTQRMDVRAKLYQCSLLGLKGHAGPNISAENIGRIGKAVTEADLEDIKVDKIATSFESLFGKPLNVATKRFPEHKFPLLLYAWFCREVIICQNMAILVYDNFKRLQNAHLAGTYISIVVARENFENIASTMVADLNRLEFEWVDELVSAFMDCIDALREQCHQFRPKYPWDELRKTEVICTSLLEEIDLGKRSDTTETLLFREIDNDETQELSVHIEIWRRTLGILDLAILAYEGAHTTDFTQQLLGDNCDTIILYETSPLSGTPGEVQSGTGLQLRRQKMKCLAEFFEGRDVWVFGRFSSQDLRSSYLSADIVTFADVWGPVWKVMDKTTEKVVTRYNVGGGSIVPWPYNPDIHPYLKPNERLCHWQSNAAAISFKKAGSSNTSERPSPSVVACMFTRLTPLQVRHQASVIQMKGKKPVPSLEVLVIRQD